MRHRTKKACQVCGKSFYGGSDYFYCPQCAKDKKLDTVVRIRTCQDCGIEFWGGPRAKRCPDCAYIAQQETKKMHKKRGPLRPIGSIDKCVICGNEYTVVSGRQKYCSVHCQRKGVLEWQREHKRGYNKTSGQYAKKIERRKQAQKICVYCQRAFTSDKPTNLCSEHCRREQKRMRDYAAALNRGSKADYDRLIKLREDYREAVKYGGDLSGYSGGRKIDYSKFTNLDLSMLTRGEREAIAAKIQNPDMGVLDLAEICGLSAKSIPTLLSRAVHKLKM